MNFTASPRMRWALLRSSLPTTCTVHITGVTLVPNEESQLLGRSDFRNLCPGHRGHFRFSARYEFFIALAIGTPLILRSVLLHMLNPRSRSPCVEVALGTGVVDLRSGAEDFCLVQGRGLRDGAKETDPNLRFLWFSANICGFLRFPAPSTCFNFQEKGLICNNQRFSVKVGVFVPGLSPSLVNHAFARMTPAIFVLLVLFTGSEQESPCFTGFVVFAVFVEPPF